jgi:hypothetical protein
VYECHDRQTLIILKDSEKLKNQICLMRALLHFSEQYLTFGQSLIHFLRQLKGFLQVKQIFDGRSFLLI